MVQLSFMKMEGKQKGGCLRWTALRRETERISMTTHSSVWVFLAASCNENPHFWNSCQASWLDFSVQIVKNKILVLRERKRTVKIIYRYYEIHGSNVFCTQLRETDTTAQFRCLRELISMVWCVGTCCGLMYSLLPSRVKITTNFCLSQSYFSIMFELDNFWLRLAMVVSNIWVANPV